MPRASALQTMQRRDRKLEIGLPQGGDVGSHVTAEDGATALNAAGSGATAVTDPMAVVTTAGGATAVIAVATGETAAGTSFASILSVETADMVTVASSHTKVVDVNKS